MPLLQAMLMILIDRENQTLQKTHNHNLSGFISKNKAKVIEISWNKGTVVSIGIMCDIIEKVYDLQLKLKFWEIKI